MFSFKGNQKREKPDFVYHGSPFDLEQINPSGNHKRDNEDGLLVFATPDIAFATMYFSPRADDSWSNKGRINGVYYFVCSDEKRFREEDKGGFLYTFDGDKFECNPDKGIGWCEWTNNNAVVPIRKDFSPSSLIAMIDNNVQVYFTKKEVLDEIKGVSDHGLQILRKMHSENQKIGKNAIKM